MIKSDATSLLDNTAMLYKQTVSSRHDACLDKSSFKCKIGENCSNIYLNRCQISNFKLTFTPMEDYFHCYPVR